MSPRTSTGRNILVFMTDGKRRFVREIAAELGMQHDVVRKICTRFTVRGMLLKEQCEGVGVYRITDAGAHFQTRNEPMDGPAKGSRAEYHRGSLRARAWRVMRMREWWSVSDLLLTIADGTEKDAEKGLTRYVRALSLAGYVVPSKRTPDRWRLVQNTGHLAPALNTQARTLTDPNTGEVHDVRS